MCVCTTFSWCCYDNAAEGQRYDEWVKKKTGGGVRRREKQAGKCVCVCGSLWTLISHACARWRCALCYYIIKTVNHISTHTVTATVGHTHIHTHTHVNSPKVNAINVKHLWTKCFSLRHTHKQTKNMSSHTNTQPHCFSISMPTIVCVCVCIGDSMTYGRQQTHHSNHTATTPKHVCMCVRWQRHRVDSASECWCVHWWWHTHKHTHSN